jgi:hypothetical protein
MRPKILTAMLLEIQVLIQVYCDLSLCHLANSY